MKLSEPSNYMYFVVDDYLIKLPKKPIFKPIRRKVEAIHKGRYINIYA